MEADKPLNNKVVLLIFLAIAFLLIFGVLSVGNYGQGNKSFDRLVEIFWFGFGAVVLLLIGGVRLYFVLKGLSQGYAEVIFRYGSSIPVSKEKDPLGFYFFAFLGSIFGLMFFLLGLALFFCFILKIIGKSI